MNEIAKQNSTAVTPYGVLDPFEAFANAAAPRSIVGKLLRFTKGDFLAGEDDEQIEEGSVFTVNLDGVLTGWIRWWDGKPAEQRMVLVSSGQAPPTRAELGDMDREQWGLDTSGEPRDPWQPSCYLPMLSQDGELYTFTTSSRGGRNAIGDLARAYARHRRAHPDEFPLVVTEVGSYQHSNREFGRIKFPKLTIRSWEPKERFNAALVEAGLTPIDVDAPEPLAPIADDLNDEVPF